MLSFEDGMREMIAEGIIDKEQAEILLEAEAFAVAESFDLPDDVKPVEQIKDEYTISGLKAVIRKHNKAVEKKDRLKLGGTEEELIVRLIAAGVEL